MKIKVTKKEMINRYDTIICIGYCDAQYLLKFENKIAYSTRVEGWACDYYDINNILISTGYAPLTEKKSIRSYEILSKYEDKAREIVCNYSLNYEEQKKQVRLLLESFITEVTKK